MRYRTLGAAGPAVSAVACGTWNLYGPGMAESDALAIMRAALNAGITTFDSADTYGAGAGEALLCKLLSATHRENLVLCTKVGLPVDGWTAGGLSRRHVVDSCHRSLRRLGTNYIDLYQAHRHDPSTPIEETIGALAHLVHKGVVRYVGVSEWPLEAINHAHVLAKEAGIPLVSNQCQYSMLWRVPEQNIIPADDSLGIGHMAYSPLAQGVLAGRYAPASRFPEDSRAVRLGASSSVHRYLSDNVTIRVDRLRPLARELGMTIAQLAIAWVLRDPRIACAIVGASRVQQLEETCSAVDFSLSPEALRRVDQVLGDLIESDPSKEARPYDVSPRWKRKDAQT